MGIGCVYRLCLSNPLTTDSDRLTIQLNSIANGNF